jgi:hypothetical protein
MTLGEARAAVARAVSGNGALSIGALQVDRRDLWVREVVRRPWRE